MRVLAGDIGGTNARFGYVDVEAGVPSVVAADTLPSRSAPTLADLVRRFQADTGLSAERACFAVACPVEDGECRTANLPWTLSVSALAREIGIARTMLINDFEAIGYGLPHLRPDGVHTLQDGVPAQRSPIALLGPGTGLGVAFVTWEEDGYRVHPSEAGHTSFAPATSVQSALREALARRFGHVSHERVLSGRGLVNVYEFLAASGAAPESAVVRAAMSVGDPAAAISARALDRSDALSLNAVELFLDILGSFAGNVALTIRARGGVYLGGGIAPRLLELLGAPRVLEAFRDKGRLSDLLTKVPLRVITEPGVAVLGAAVAAARG